MDREVALATLRDMVAPTSRPTLEDATLERVLDAYAIADRYGVAPGGDDWEGVWDLNAAAANAWEMKAAKVAGDFTFSADGASYSKGDVLAKCVEMAARYAAKSTSVVSVHQHPTLKDLPRDWDGVQVP